MSTSNLISIGAIIDKSWEHYSKNFKQLITISLWYFLVALLLTIGAILSPADNGLLLQGGSFTAVEALGLSITVLTSLIVTPLVGVWISMSLMQMVEAQSKDKTANLKAINQKTWSKMISYLVMGLLRGLAMMLPILLIVPGIALIVTNVFTDGGSVLGGLALLLTFLGTIAALAGCFFVSISLSFSGLELVLADQGITQSLKSSLALVKGRFWATTWRLIVPKLVYSIPVAALQIGAIASVNIGLASLSTINDAVVFKIADLTGNIIIMGITALVTPIILISDYLVYDSLRKNK